MTPVPVRMNEQQYADIAAGCDMLLRAPGANVARLAVPALHFLNEHPSSLAQYAAALTSRNAGGFSHLSGAMIRVARALMHSRGVGRPAPPPHSPIDVVIVSHLLRPQQLHQEDDFYFGALQSQLRGRGATSLLVLIDHLSGDRGNQYTQPFPSPRMVLPTTMPLATEARIWRQCARTWWALRREAARAGRKVERQLAMLASRQALSSATIANLRMHAAIADLCQAVNPKIVITTYEGTVAERLIWQAARTAPRRPLCVGYQHALVLERAHAIRRSVAAAGVDCDPDVILTLGTLSHAALTASAGLRSLRFIEYGSHRRANLPVLPRPQDRPRNCLVLPDASDQESATLFEFALRCAHHSPDIRFVLRPHPMVDTPALLRRHPVLRLLPPNVALSLDKALELEFAQARYCLYRGSSAALYAVLAGIKPFYFAQAAELPFDCLHELPEWRETVTSPEDFACRIRVADTFADSATASRAAGVCERYVAPIRPAAISELLAMVS